ncbi:Protein of unknown function [Paenibacillus sp. UNCCL117]|uniref:DUF3866 family protein n=1 Tax=unclassified Paenibacillus TaxID=185978 RepID=UPI000881AA96|nr:MULTISPECIES: DUF3866 family protein [unclassified Paenibacillus]SDC37756.1 Protein of unknown function [Paenibacillus sp. cl123]SFW14619.1 Protein of unknown function [Paenibacillus sp. UNCCL117]
MRIDWEWGHVLEVLGELEKLEELEKKHENLEKLPGQHGGMQQVRVLLPGSAPTSELALHDLTCFPPLAAGDRVLVNTTAVRLGLGTGGYHFVQAVLPKELPAALQPAAVCPSAARKFGCGDCLPGAPPTTGTPENAAAMASPGEPSESASPDIRLHKVEQAGLQAEGHIMKLRYTSAQRAVLAVEEPGSPHHDMLRAADSLDGVPVLIGELHSMLPVAAAWLRHKEAGRGPGSTGLRLAYVMSDGGALPLGISRHAARLRGLGWLEGTVTYGHAYGGDLEAVNKFTALLAARHVLRAGLIIAVMGPGIAGTGTAYGFSGMETAELVNAVRALGGQPVLIPRIGFADKRERHRGLSAHTRIALGPAAQARAVVPLPLLADQAKRSMLRGQEAEAALAARHEVLWLSPPPAEDIGLALAAYGPPVTTMGRGLAEEPAFFQAVCTAAGHAYERYLALRASPRDE